MQSNQTKLRKKLARDVEDEIFTINTAIDNLVNKIKPANLKSLKKLDYRKLKSIRSKLNQLGYTIRDINSEFDSLHESGWGQHTAIDVDGQSVWVHESEIKKLSQ